MEKMPLLFVGHGSPMNAIEENQFVSGWKKVSGLIQKPRAVLCISAHWETRGTQVTAMNNPPTIHDFGGFPGALYEVSYPAPGSPSLAKEIIELVKNRNITPDEKWGLDHGCWSVLKHFFPEADIPVVQISLDYTAGPQSHYLIARELAPLRNNGILIIGSGNIVHNLAMVAWDRLNDEDYGYEWASEAKEKMKHFIIHDDHKSLIDYTLQGRAFNLSVPTPEHFLPLLYILSLKEKDESVSFFNDKCVAGSLAMTSLLIK